MGNSYRDNATPTGIVSGEFGTEVITIAAGIGVGSDQSCREVIIWPENNKDIRIGESVTAAASGPWLQKANSSYLTIPISNTDKLHFNGTNGDKVYLLWRS